MFSCSLDKQGQPVDEEEMVLIEKEAIGWVPSSLSVCVGILLARLWFKTRDLGSRENKAGSQGSQAVLKRCVCVHAHASV